MDKSRLYPRRLGGGCCSGDVSSARPGPPSRRTDPAAPAQYAKRKLHTPGQLYALWFRRHSCVSVPSSADQGEILFRSRWETSRELYARSTFSRTSLARDNRFSSHRARRSITETRMMGRKGPPPKCHFGCRFQSVFRDRNGQRGWHYE